MLKCWMVTGLLEYKVLWLKCRIWNSKKETLCLLHFVFLSLGLRKLNCDDQK